MNVSLDDITSKTLAEEEKKISRRMNKEVEKQERNMMTERAGEGSFSLASFPQKP